MSFNNQAGSAMGAAAIVVLALCLIVSLSFGFKAFTEGQDYKKNSDKKVAAAVEATKASETTKLTAQFEQQQKSPYKTYSGPVTYGSITFSYSKTWSAYVNDSNSSQPINGYFHPDIVPAATTTAYALRVELLSTPYAQALQQFDSQIKTGKLKAVAYIPPKLNGVTNVQPGTRLEGAISQTQNGSMVIIKIRDKTLKIYTQSQSFVPDFNNVVLPSLTFTP